MALREACGNVTFIFGRPSAYTEALQRLGGIAWYAKASKLKAKAKEQKLKKDKLKRQEERSGLEESVSQAYPIVDKGPTLSVERNQLVFPSSRVLGHSHFTVPF